MTEADALTDDVGHSGASRRRTESRIVAGPQARIDVGAVRSNVERLAEVAGDAAVMAVVKADAYGHGLLPCARAARAGGAAWLGVALVSEALELRAAGDTGAVLAWLTRPGDHWAEAVSADVDLGVNAPWAIDQVTAAAVATGRVARVHLCVDTGLGREGATAWEDLVRVAAGAQASGAVEVVGIWSHLAYADDPSHPTVAAQHEAFDAALVTAARHGVVPQLRHLANSAATLTSPALHYDVVRPGIAVYGISPGPEVGTSFALGLRPAMTLTAPLVLVKDVAVGQGVSYAHAYHTSTATRLGLVPLGYADGLPRSASNAGPFLVGGERRTVAGRVCMDQVVLDLGDLDVHEGDEVIAFGPGDHGEPTADDWALASGTIAYEIVTRIGPRVPRTFTDEV